MEYHRLLMSEQEQPKTDEKYCSECGEIIKEKAEICPNCGVRQQSAPKQSKYSQDEGVRKLQKRAEKSKNMAAIWGLLLSPYGYYYVGSTKLALLNLFTLNYMLFGVIIVPFHVNKMIQDARDELDDMGIEYEE